MTAPATPASGALMASSVLVVDDEPDLLTLYELTLLREGLEVETANSVAQAREMLRSRVFRAVISDMRLPDGTGLDLLKWLEQGGRPEKVIVVTAYGSPENAVTALKAGAFDYLTKPVDLRQFRAVGGGDIADRHTGRRRRYFWTGAGGEGKHAAPRLFDQHTFRRQRRQRFADRRAAHPVPRLQLVQSRQALQAVPGLRLTQILPDLFFDAQIERFKFHKA